MTEESEQHCLHCSIIDTVEAFSEEHPSNNQLAFVTYALESLANVVVTIISHYPDIELQAILMRGFLSCLDSAVQRSQKPAPGEYMQ
jgi:hypothetical protein